MATLGSAVQKINAIAPSVQQMQVRRAQAKTNAHAFRQNVARYRLDGGWLPSGKYLAVLTVTLPDQHTFRFTSECDPHDVARLTMAIRPEVGSFLGDVWKGVKKVTKKVATSGVFKVATSALALAAPALGPLAPAALAAAGALKATRALVAARAHSAKGNKDAAAKLVAYANKASKVSAAINVKASERGLPTSMKSAASSVSKGKKKPAKVVPIDDAVRDHAQQASAKVYTMLLRPA
jgi:hypothetical protein